MYSLRMGLAFLTATAVSSCAPTRGGTGSASGNATTDSEDWTRVERPALLGVQRLLANQMDQDALLLARARLADTSLPAPERMWLSIYEGIALDRLGRREEAIAAYGRARDVHAHPVALDGLERPVRNLRHIADFQARHAVPPAHRDAFVARMEQDRARYGRQNVDLIEGLYQVSNRERNTPVARAALEKLLRDFPESNRAGCGALYLAQWEPAAGRAALLRAVIEHHADAIYGDGVQVGAYATFQLAELADSETERNRLLADLEARWPHAVGHDGRPLTAGAAPH